MLRTSSLTLSVYCFVCSVWATISTVQLAFPFDLVLHDAATQVYFSPKGGAQEALVREIGQAKESIYVQAYSFTSEPIIQALIAAHHRGVQVEIILDKSQENNKRSGTAAVREAGIHTAIDRKHAIAHNERTIRNHEDSFLFSLLIM